MAEINIAGFDTALDFNDELFEGVTNGYAYVFNKKQFTNEDGIVVMASQWTPGSAAFEGNFFERTTWAVDPDTGRITVDGFATNVNPNLSNPLLATTNAQGKQVSSYTLALFTEDGSYIQTVFSGIRVPQAPTSTTWETLEIYSQTTVQNFPAWYFDADQVLALLSQYTSTALKSAVGILGVSAQSYAPTNANFPISAAITDPALGLYRGTSTKANLSAIANPITGQRVKLSDRSRQWMRYNGLRWSPENGNVADVMDFCDPTAADNTAGLQAAIDALVSMNGGTLLFPADYTFEFSGQLNFTQRYNIIFQGTNISRFANNIRVNLRFTGSGTNSAFDLRSCSGIAFKNIAIEYTNAAYTGWLMQTGHDVSGADTQKLMIDACVIKGTPTATNAAGLVDLNKSIIGSITNTQFRYAAKGIRGQIGAGYAYVYLIQANDFNNITHCIWNPDEWCVWDNTFSPDTLGVTRAIGADGTPTSNFTRCISIKGNYAGDGSGDAEPIYNLKDCLGVDFSNNFTTISGQDAVWLSGCIGVNIHGNRFENPSADGRGVVLIDESSYGVEVRGNSIDVGMSAADCIVELELCIGLAQSGNTRGGSPLQNLQTFGQVIRGSTFSDTVAALNTSITFGAVRNTIDVGVGAAIRYNDGTAPGFNAGDLVIQSGNAAGGASATIFTANTGGSGFDPFITAMLPSGQVNFKKFGYYNGLGIGGAVTQLTSRTTSVTLNKPSGTITLFAAAGSATPFSFVVNNSTVGALDTIRLSQQSGADPYRFDVTAVGAGSFRITGVTITGTTNDAPVINFSVLKGSNS